MGCNLSYDMKQSLFISEVGLLGWMHFYSKYLLVSHYIYISFFSWQWSSLKVRRPMCYIALLVPALELSYINSTKKPCQTALHGVKLWFVLSLLTRSSINVKMIVSDGISCVSSMTKFWKHAMVGSIIKVNISHSYYFIAFDLNEVNCRYRGFAILEQMHSLHVCFAKLISVNIK